MRPTYQTAHDIFAENNGIMRASLAVKAGVDRKTLAEMAEAGILLKEARGIYRLAALPPLENPDLVQVALRVPMGVACLISALYIHNLTTQIPHKVYIALPAGTKRPRITYPPLDVIKLSPNAYRAGIDIHSLDGIKVRVYNREKTVADCFKFRNKIGLDVAIEALKDYLRSPGHSIERLLHYAKIDRMANIMRPYLEASV